MTTVAITDLGSLIPPGTHAGWRGPDLPADARSRSRFAAKGRVIYLGVGDAVDDRRSCTSSRRSSLADQAVLQAGAAERSLDGSPHGACTSPCASAVELASVSPGRDAWPSRTSDIKPYVKPIDSASISTTSEASGTRSRLVITVSQP